MTELQETLARMQAAHTAAGMPDAAQRKAWLTAAIQLLIENRDALCEAMSQDFGHRSEAQSTLGDVVAAVSALRHARKHVAAWMRPERRKPEFPLGLLGAKASILYRPKGVVGIVAPWNFPVGMVFSPLAGALAAGNRVMAKPSEFTPATSALMNKLVTEYFDATVFRVVEGDSSVGIAFSSLPFNHLFFTGSTEVGRHVMRAAAENLVPVTLELGGKSPTVIGHSVDMRKAALRIMHGKTFNAGQICVAPDYVLVPENQRDHFIEAARTAVASMYPNGLLNDDAYSSIVNTRHFERLNELLDDARQKGADVIEVNPGQEAFTEQPQRKMPPHILSNVNDDMRIMQEEIFGPLLPVITYRQTQDAVAEIIRRPHPLALYFFGRDKTEAQSLINATHSGGVAINDTIFQVAQEQLPFGGIGASGMGHYHGLEGVRTFSQARSVFTQSRSELLKLFRPPYSKTFWQQMKSRLKP